MFNKPRGRWTFFPALCARQELISSPRTLYPNCRLRITSKYPWKELKVNWTLNIFRYTKSCIRICMKLTKFHYSVWVWRIFYFLARTTKERETYNSDICIEISPGQNQHRRCLNNCVVCKRNQQQRPCGRLRESSLESCQSWILYWYLSEECHKNDVASRTVWEMS